MKPDYRKIIQALNYFASTKDNQTLEKIKAYKLIWLADRYHIRQYGRPITEDIYYALPNGPVPSATKYILDEESTKVKIDNSLIDPYLKIIDEYTYKSLEKPNIKVFSKSEQDVLLKIDSSFGEMPSYDLSLFSHIFPEWTRFEDKINTKKIKCYKIKESDFFINVEDKSNLFVDGDELIDITKQLYLENR